MLYERVLERIKWLEDKIKTLEDRVIIPRNSVKSYQNLLDINKKYKLACERARIKRRR